MAKRRAISPIPKFRSEAKEREFWETHDTAAYIDWSRATFGVFPNLKTSTEAISLRLPASLLAELKTQANKRDVPYQSLLKVYLAERLAQERVGERSARRKKPLRPRGARQSTQSAGRVVGRARG
jgi:predicted DNA binding CopG/RHH family protein